MILISLIVVAIGFEWEENLMLVPCEGQLTIPVGVT